MGPRLRILLLAFLLLGGLGLAACATKPTYPLYSPAQATGSFGYYEESLGDHRWRIGYRAPIARAYSLSRTERRREADRLVSLAYDLALMRAAELTLAQGEQYFSVSDRENDVETNVEDQYAYDPFFAPWPYYGYRYYYSPYVPFGSPVYRDRYTEVAVEVSFVVDLRPAPGRESFDAREALEWLRAKYPQPPAAPGT